MIVANHFGIDTVFHFSRFPTLLPYGEPKEIDALCEEFTMYQLMDALPEEAVASALVEDETDDSISTHQRLDKVWDYLSKLQICGQAQFPKLSKVAKLVLTLPHSNAEEERVFSVIRKNKTPFRPSLDPDETLGSIVTIKSAIGDKKIHQITIPESVLAKAKKATWDYNKLHKM